VRLRWVVLAALGAHPADAQTADVQAGAHIFLGQCGACHSTQPGQTRVGPSLSGIVGRPSGSVPGYTYSSANLAAKLVWDSAALDRYLTNPRAVIPGTKMPYGGLRDPAERADLIAYLASLH
jgi:cytochrome c